MENADSALLPSQQVGMLLLPGHPIIGCSCDGSVRFLENYGYCGWSRFAVLAEVVMIGQWRRLIKCRPCMCVCMRERERELNLFKSTTASFISPHLNWLSLAWEGVLVLYLRVRWASDPDSTPNSTFSANSYETGARKVQRSCLRPCMW